MVINEQTVRIQTQNKSMVFTTGSAAKMRVPGARRVHALVLLLLAAVGATGEYVVVGPGSGVVGGGCDSAIVPANGAVGDCPDSLAHGEDCTPTCDDVYELVGRHSCTDGVLVEATCWPVDGDDVCDADAGRCGAVDQDDPGFWDSPAWRGRALWTPPSEWDDPDERLPHVHLHDAAMKRYTELLEERQGSAY